MIDYRWVLIALNLLAALAVVARLRSDERNRGLNGFLLGVNLVAAVWATSNILDGS